MTRNFIIAIFVSVAAFAQQQPSFPEDDSNGGISIELPNVELTEIILEYQKYTDEHVILDTSAQGTLTIVSNPNKGMTKTEAIEFIKASLLLNGFAIVPVRPGISKLLNHGTNAPSREGVGLYTTPEGLPDGEEVINYVMKLKYITPEEAVRNFNLIIPNHSYGQVTPVNNAGAVVITENATTVKKLIELVKIIDVPSAQLTEEMIRLERADADEVAGIVNEILGAQSSQRSSAGSSRTIAVGAAATALRGGSNNQAGGGAAGGGGAPDQNSVIVQAVTRLNSILVIARPVDVIYIKNLITKLDAPAEFKNLLKRQLRFRPVLDFIDVAADALTRGLEETTSGSGGAGRAGGQPNQRNNQQQSNRRGGGAGGRSGSNSGLSGSSQRGSGLSGAGGETVQPPASVIVGKTLLIADPQSNTLIVSGPPEQLSKIDELISAIDIRPRQVYISAIIAQVTLSDDIQLGVDLLRRVEDIEFAGQNISVAGAFQSGQGTGILDPTQLINFGDFVATAGTDDPLSGLSAVRGFNGLNTYLGIGEFLNAYVRALETTNKFKVLARPTIFTANNSPARLSSGQRIPIPTSTQSTVVAGNSQSLNSNIEFEDVLLEIEVLPLINSDDEVTLQIAQINDSVNGSTIIDGNPIPNITTEELETLVSVPNGAIVIVGGLIQESENRSTTGLPFLSKIPFLKNLSGANTKDKDRSELLVFIQPQIIETTADLETANRDEARRSVIPPDAYEFAKPPYKNSGSLFPNWNSSSSRNLNPVAPSRPPRDWNPEDDQSEIERLAREIEARKAASE